MSSGTPKVDPLFCVEWKEAKLESFDFLDLSCLVGASRVA